MTIKSQYQDLLHEGTRLLETFTISYPYGPYKESRFSSTYDGMSGWVRNLLSLVSEVEPLRKEDPLYQRVRAYRGRIGDLDRESFVNLLESLRERCLS